MPDDPREILKAAGVECAEVDAWADDRMYWYHIPGDDPDARIMIKLADKTILALARLVAKYKWIAERHESVVDRVVMDRKPQFDALEARWDADHA